MAKRVLVACADADRAAGLCRALSGSGAVDAVVAPDTQAALSLGRDGEVEAAVLVHAPPKLDALAIAAGLRAGRGPAEAVAAVALCDAGDPAIELQFLEAGILELLPAGADAPALDRALLRATVRQGALRAEVQRAVERSEARLTAVIEGLPVGVGVTDAVGRTLSLNATALGLHGFRTTDEMLHSAAEYQGLFELRDGAGRALPVEAWPLARALRGERVVDQEVRLHRRDTGRERTLSYSAVSLPDGDANGSRFVFVMQDVSERQQTEARLRESEARYRTLFESIDEGYCLVEVLFDDGQRPVDYRFLETNPAFQRQTGLVGALGRTARDLVPGLDEFWFQVYGQVALTGESARFQNHAPAMGRWFDVYALRVGAPEQRRVGILFRDISEARHAEEALRQSETRFRDLADNMSQLAWMVDGQGRVSWFNRRWLEYTGTTIESMALHGWESVIHPEHAARVLAKFRVHLQTGEPWEDTFLMRGRDGSYRWFLSRAQPTRDDGGQVIWWFGTNTDITAQRQVQEAAEEAGRVLREADQRKNEFLAMLSHELRNPLAPIRNSVYLLERAPPGSDLARRAREVIDRQAQHMVRLVDDLLDVTRISRGKIILQRTRLDFGALVRSAVEDHRETFARRGVRLDFVAPPRPLYVNGDGTRLAQVVGNLLTNAAKFARQGGGTWIRLDADGQRVTLRVRDDGVGIAPETLARLFQPFVQADSTLDRSQGGLGLGLALVKGLTEMHGGTAGATSDGLGRGAEFTVSLPLVEGASGERGSTSGEAAPPGQRRILIIEDNVDAAETLRGALELGQHLVDVAHTGPEGLERARAFRPEIVICDIGLPGLDGFEVARALRADPAVGSAFLVALSGYAQREDVERAREAGFDRHMAKPPRLEALEALIAEAPR